VLPASWSACLSPLPSFLPVPRASACTAACTTGSHYCLPRPFPTHLPPSTACSYLFCTAVPGQASQAVHFFAAPPTCAARPRPLARTWHSTAYRSSGRPVPYPVAGIHADVAGRRGLRMPDTNSVCGSGRREGRAARAVNLYTKRWLIAWLTTMHLPHLHHRPGYYPLPAAPICLHEQTHLLAGVTAGYLPSYTLHTAHIPRPGTTLHCALLPPSAHKPVSVSHLAHIVLTALTGAT